MFEKSWIVSEKIVSPKSAKWCINTTKQTTNPAEEQLLKIFSRYVYLSFDTTFNRVMLFTKINWVKDWLRKRSDVSKLDISIRKISHSINWALMATRVEGSPRDNQLSSELIHTALKINAFQNWKLGYPTNIEKLKKKSMWIIKIVHIWNYWYSP